MSERHKARIMKTSCANFECLMNLPLAADLACLAAVVITTDVASYVSTRVRSRYSFWAVKRTSAQFLRIQSGPAWQRAWACTVVVNAMTLAPAALPDRIPAGTSSTTTHSPAGKPRAAAAFKYG